MPGMTYQAVNSTESGRIESLSAEVERLRGALEYIANYYGDGHRVTELAHEALEASHENR